MGLNGVYTFCRFYGPVIDVGARDGKEYFLALEDAGCYFNPVECERELKLNLDTALTKRKLLSEDQVWLLARTSFAAREAFKHKINEWVTELSTEVVDVEELEQRWVSQRDLNYEAIRCLLERTHTQSEDKEVVVIKKFELWDAPSNPDGNILLLQNFQECFGRPMYAAEYFKYRGEIKQCHDIKEQKALLSGIATQHKRRFDRVSKIYNRYSGQDHPLSEETYVGALLTAVDTSGFVDAFRTRLLSGEPYRDAMMKRVVHEYQGLYDADMPKEESEFAVVELQRRQMALDDAALTDVLVELKQQHEDITSRISTIFMRVLQREPEPEEISQYTIGFRYSGLDDLKLEEKLCSGLEFQDHLRELIYEASGNHLPRAKLFARLQAVLERKPKTVAEAKRFVFDQIPETKNIRQTDL
ncbi:hypothetical protein CEUSTIGMA_g12564.t1 [Chlamydomonas eustigma]|uniref:Uncharacterized protein n=1 Tax=Chlamydomonas eustigma TaxID=1157962 RepID=A0A250XQ07_9CHLO|nr:hypothetical protein CEUSTIGMA_g12564.t1 [Chlamydomonas eustigma]|eukprot:GAX85145.1 hypothetical protein CEUSTIGMA_g12564.t1 [Chlamydomonas eustigma]